MRKKPTVTATGYHIKRRVNITPYILIAPMFILLFVFSAWPLIISIIKSFYRYDALKINEYVGLENYKNLLFHDKAFWQSMKNLLFLFLAMHICFCLPIIASKLVHSVRNERFQYTMRTVFVLPIVVPSVVIMLLWKFIYYPQIGLIARIASFFELNPPNLLGTASTAIPAIIFIGFPWIAGLSFLILFAALQNVDQSLIEAAKLDGAGTFKTFFCVELPIIKPQIKALYLLALISQFQDYERFLILTDGGPNNATLVPGLHMYHLAFSSSGESEYGYACAIAVVLFLITMILSRLVIKNREDE